MFTYKNMPVGHLAVKAIIISLMITMLYTASPGIFFLGIILSLFFGSTEGPGNPTVDLFLFIVIGVVSKQIESLDTIQEERTLDACILSIIALYWLIGDYLRVLLLAAWLPYHYARTDIVKCCVYAALAVITPTLPYLYRAAQIFGPLVTAKLYRSIKSTFSGLQENLIKAISATPFSPFASSTPSTSDSLSSPPVALSLSALITTANPKSKKGINTVMVSSSTQTDHLVNTGSSVMVDSSTQTDSSIKTQPTKTPIWVVDKNIYGKKNRRLSPVRSPKIATQLCHTPGWIEPTPDSMFKRGEPSRVRKQRLWEARYGTLTSIVAPPMSLYTTPAITGGSSAVRSNINSARNANNSNSIDNNTTTTAASASASVDTITRIATEANILLDIADAIPTTVQSTSSDPKLPLTQPTVPMPLNMTTTSAFLPEPAPESTSKDTPSQVKVFTSPSSGGSEDLVVTKSGSAAPATTAAESDPNMSKAYPSPSISLTSPISSSVTSPVSSLFVSSPKTPISMAQLIPAPTSELVDDTTIPDLSLDSPPVQITIEEEPAKILDPCPGSVSFDETTITITSPELSSAAPSALLSEPNVVPTSTSTSQGYPLPEDSIESSYVPASVPSLERSLTPEPSTLTVPPSPLPLDSALISPAPILCEASTEHTTIPMSSPVLAESAAINVEITEPQQSLFDAPLPISSAASADPTSHTLPAKPALTSNIPLTNTPSFDTRTRKRSHDEAEEKKSTRNITTAPSAETKKRSTSSSPPTSVLLSPSPPPPPIFTSFPASPSNEAATSSSSPVSVLPSPPPRVFPTPLFPTYTTSPSNENEHPTTAAEPEHVAQMDVEPASRPGSFIITDAPVSSINTYLDELIKDGHRHRQQTVSAVAADDEDIPMMVAASNVNTNTDLGTEVASETMNWDFSLDGNSQTIDPSSFTLSGEEMNVLFPEVESTVMDILPDQQQAENLSDDMLVDFPAVEDHPTAQGFFTHHMDQDSENLPDVAQEDMLMEETISTLPHYHIQPTDKELENLPDAVPEDIPFNCDFLSLPLDYFTIPTNLAPETIPNATLEDHIPMLGNYPMTPNAPFPSMIDEQQSGMEIPADIVYHTPYEAEVSTGLYYHNEGPAVDYTPALTSNQGRVEGDNLQDPSGIENQGWAENYTEDPFSTQQQAMGMQDMITGAWAGQFAANQAAAVVEEANWNSTAAVRSDLGPIDPNLASNSVPVSAYLPTVTEEAIQYGSVAASGNDSDPTGPNLYPGTGPGSAYPSTTTEEVDGNSAAVPGRDLGLIDPTLAPGSSPVNASPPAVVFTAVPASPAMSLATSMASGADRATLAPVPRMPPKASRPTPAEPPIAINLAVNESEPKLDRRFIINDGPSEQLQCRIRTASPEGRRTRRREGGPRLKEVYSEEFEDNLGFRFKVAWGARGSPPLDTNMVSQLERQMDEAAEAIKLYWVARQPGIEEQTALDKAAMKARKLKEFEAKKKAQIAAYQRRQKARVTASASVFVPKKAPNKKRP